MNPNPAASATSIHRFGRSQFYLLPFFLLWSRLPLPSVSSFSGSSQNEVRGSKLFAVLGLRKGATSV